MNTSARFSILGIVMGGLLLSISGTDAHAGDVRVVTKYSRTNDRVITHHVNMDSTHRVRVVQRQIVDPSAMVSRRLHEQPVYGHLAEVRVDHQTIYMDPQVDYLRQGHTTRTDRNSMTEAMSEYRHQVARSNRIIRGGMQMMDRSSMDDMGHMVIFRRPDLNGQTPGMRIMPSIPSMPKVKENEDKMVANHGNTKAS